MKSTRITAIAVIAASCASVYAQPTCPPTICPPATPSVTPVASPTPVTSNVSYKSVQSRYGSFGSRWALPFEGDWNPPANPFLFAPPPFASADGYAYPNTWAPLSAQGVYRSGLWDSGDQVDDFAKRAHIMAGFYAGGLVNIESGLNKTRWNLAQNHNTNAPLSPSQAKYAVGALNHAGALRGLSDLDDLRIVGSANYASTHFYDTTDTEVGPTNPAQARRIYVLGMAGVEGFAQIGPRISPDLKTSDGPVDGKVLPSKPGDLNNPTAAVVDYMIGMSGGVLVDNKKTNFCLDDGASTNRPAGLIREAYAVRATVGAGNGKSYVNVNNARGLMTILFLADDLTNVSPGHFCNDCERTDSRIGSWTAVESIGVTLPIPATCPSVEIEATAAYFGADQNPSSGGGAARLYDPRIGASEKAIEPERHTGMVSRGDVVVGDGYNDTASSGFSTDVLRVNDVLHLSPRKSPPEFDDRVAPSDRVGLLYFDVERNTLRLSVALPDSEKSAVDWKDSRIGWVDVALDYSSFDPATDTAPVKTALSPEEVELSLLTARASAIRGDSVYLKPSVEILLGGFTESSLDLTVVATGFQSEQPEFLLRLPGRGPDGVASTNWIEIPPEAVIPSGEIGASETYSIFFEFPEGSIRRGEKLQAGDIAQILSVHPNTGQTAGYSIRIK